MSILIYLFGVCISAAVWFILIKFRQEGFYLPFPVNRMETCWTR